MCRPQIDHTCVFQDKVLGSGSGSRSQAAARASQRFGNGSAAPRSPCKRRARGPAWRGLLWTGLISVWRFKFIVQPDFLTVSGFTSVGVKGFVSAQAVPAAL